MTGALEKPMDHVFTADEDLALIRDAAVRAGDVALQYYEGMHALEVTWKEGNSPVSAADHAVNEMLMSELGAARPHYGWLSEETGDTDINRRIEAPRCFVVDPIDGTRGFINRLDQWCISIAVVEANRPIAGVLVCPARDEVFVAKAGGGAWLNGERLSMGYGPKGETLIGGPRIYIDAMDRETDWVIHRFSHVPSLAYRIALVASGRMDATFIKPHAHDWDIAAADLILAEAGGVLVDENGADVSFNERNVRKPAMVAGHPDLIETMLEIVVQTPFN